jgi:hypothetical protein
MKATDARGNFVWQSLRLDDYPSPVPENSDSEKDIRVSIVEDDAGVRESLADLIGHVPGLICVGAHPDAESALAPDSEEGRTKI